MMTTEVKQQIIEGLALRRDNFAGSDVKFAISIGINNSQYSRLKKRETERILSEQNWISLARILGISLGDIPVWNIANTPAFQFIMTQLDFCQTNSSSRILCDISEIGKTFTGMHYSKVNKNAIYVDCSQVKNRQKLIRFIAKEFGVGHTGKYSDVYADLVFYLRSLPTPLIILDEAGDLEYPAFLELKALWNATERCCGWYMMGADGLKEKIRRSIDAKKVGYTELFSRYGSRYQKVAPDTTNEIRKYKQVLCALIIQANAPRGIDIPKMIAKCDYSPRRIQDELRKIA